MDYNINGDIKLTLELLDLNVDELSKELNFSIKTLSRYIDKNNLNNNYLSIFYNYVYRKKIKLNLIKSMFYKEELLNNHILLFHGAKTEIIGEIDHLKGRYNNDLGNGFYCGESYEQSATFISKFDNSSIYTLDFNLSNLTFYKYDVSLEWMLTIAYFRRTLNNYENHPLIISLKEKILNKDYIIAPIADNRMFRIIDSFIKGEITDEQCKHCLASTNLGYQYVMISSKATKNIKILERYYLSLNEREYFNSLKKDDLKLRDDKVKAARIQYRGKGHYIDEVLG